MRARFALLLLGCAGLPCALWAAPPTALSVLEDQLAITTRQLDEVQVRLANQNKTVEAAQQQAERAAVSALRTSRYPKAFWYWQSFLGHAPAPGIMGAMARQQGAETLRLKAAYGTLFSLYGQAQAKQAKLLALRQSIGQAEGRTNRRQREALAKAGIDASLLAVQLAQQLGEVPPPPPPALPPEPTPTPKAEPKPKLKPKPNEASRPQKMPQAAVKEAKTSMPLEAAPHPLREATALPDLAMEEGERPLESAAQAKREVRVSAPAGRPIGGPVLVGFKQGKGAEAEGVVLGGQAGEAVASPVKGKVLFAGQFRQFGGLVIVQGQAGQDEVLGGLGEMYVAANAAVRGGKALGTLGERGRLYWEVRAGGQAKNPLTFKR